MSEENKEPTLWELLETKYARPEYVLMREVRDKAGFSANRSADGIAMALWESRGLAIHGIEIKSYRNDWLRELKAPEKADAIFKYCDRWWLVAANETVVKESEVPETWGYMVRQKTRLKVIKDAPKLSPVHLDKGFVANMLRRAVANMIHKDSIQKEIAAAVSSAKASANLNIEWKHNRLEEDHKSLQEKVRKFQDAAGITITNYDYGNIAKAVKLVMRMGGNDPVVEYCQRMKENFEKMSKDMDNIIKKYSNGQPAERIEDEY